MNPGAVVLCGGESRRMGRPKAWLPFGPERLLQRVVRLVGTVAHPVVVVAAPSQVAVGGVFVVSAQPAGGMGGYALRWSTGAAVCAATGIASERCTAESSGQYTLSVVVTDSAGQQAQGSSVVAAGGPITTGTHPTPANALPSGAVAALGVAARAAAALGGVAIAQRLRRRPIGETGPASDPPESPGPDPDEGADPFEDLI